MERKDIILSIGSFMVTELILIIFVKLYYPQEFRDMSAASYFQKTLFSEGSNVGLQSMINSLQVGFTRAVIGIPFLILGICGVLALIIYYIRQRAWKYQTEIICMWVLVLDIIVASNKYFLYHYYLLTLPCFICVLLLMKHIKPDTGMICFSGIMAFCTVFIFWILKDGLKQITFINSSTVLLIIIHLFILVLVTCFLSQCFVIRRISLFLVLTTCAFFYMNYSSLIVPKYRNERMLLIQSEEACKELFPEDFGDEPVLFLDGGTVPFYVDAPSYSRYFFCLPLKRWKEGADWELQKQKYERLMLYEGKYIVYSNWFGLAKYPDLLEKIETEYERIPDSGIWTFSPDWSFFKLDGQTDIETLRAGDDNYILIRK
nr:hypothetical protein [uncultured Acetatifactor sp.]